MKSTIAEATDLLNRVVQVNSGVDTTAKTIAQQIVKESMDFDLTNSQVEQESSIARGMQVDEDMIEVPSSECSSLFSVCAPQNSYYF